MGFYGCAHIINAISPVEHLHSNFSTDDAKRAIIAAKIATKAVNVVNFDYYKEIEQQIYNKRAISKSCIVSDNNKCKRCENLCPLRNNI